MNYFVLTPNGETGPFTVPQLNRLHAQGKIQGSQLCRDEGSAETVRLDAKFRHMGDSKDLVQAVRKDVARYNRAEGSASMMTGGTMIFSGLLTVIIRGGGPFQVGWALLIVGIGLLLQGKAQRERGRAALPAEPDARPEATPEQKPSEPSKGAYDY